MMVTPFSCRNVTAMSSEAEQSGSPKITAPGSCTWTAAVGVEESRDPVGQAVRAADDVQVVGADNPVTASDQAFAPHRRPQPQTAQPPWPLAVARRLL
jgi:hypothetical protein